MNVPDFISSISNNAIAGAYAKTWDILDRYFHPLCSVSGGSDSDIVLDIVHRLDDTHKVRYVWFNTGLEYEATKQHLDYLEHRYNIHIERVQPVKSVPVCVKEYGYPFISKLVSQKIHSLQIHGFDFKDRTFDEDLCLFPQANDGLKWWHNIGTVHIWNIDYYKHLKQFLIAYPPQLSISDKCCYYAKKLPAKHFVRDNNIDLQIIGTRKAEGGIRSVGSACFSNGKDYDTLRPVFWFNDYDKREYQRMFHIQHSDCYSVYGLKRTGCAGCPFNRYLFTEQQLLIGHEDGLLRAAHNVFTQVYEYTKLYRSFCAQQGETFSLFQEVSND